MPGAPAALFHARLDNDALCGARRIATQVEQLGLEGDHFLQLVQVHALRDGTGSGAVGRMALGLGRSTRLPRGGGDTYFEGRNLHELDVAAVLFQLHAVAQQLLPHAFLMPITHTCD